MDAEKQTTRTLWIGLLSILAAYFLVGSLYATLTPDWQVPDEPAHFNYIRQLADGEGLPVLEPGDYDQAFLSRLTAEGFPPKLSVAALEYEDHQPPLYYLVAAPVYVATGGDLAAVRFVSLLFGSGVILFAGLAAWKLFPGNAPLAITVAGFVAFVPQHVAMLAGVNNDSLSELWIALGFWLMLIAAEWKHFFALGIVLGLALLTKSLAYVLAPAAFVALLLQARRTGEDWRWFVRTSAWVFAPALLLGAIWWFRNIAVYGWPDLIGLQRHAAVVVGQPRTTEWIQEFGAGEVARRFAHTTFNSFWGQFGWMGVLMDARVYLLLRTLTIGLLVGLALAWRQRPRLSAFQRDGMIVLAAAAAITAMLYVGYNVDFVQHQGRYLFPALLPLAVGAAIGLWGWTATLARRWPTRAGLWRWLPVSIVPALAALSLLALYRFIIPTLA
ncbi:MAG: glycosyltransferase family 39 protein [Anaerolineales bacterium]